MGAGTTRVGTTGAEATGTGAAGAGTKAGTKAGTGAGAGSGISIAGTSDVSPPNRLLSRPPVNHGASVLALARSPCLEFCSDWLNLRTDGRLEGSVGVGC